MMGFRTCGNATPMLGDVTISAEQANLLSLGFNSFQIQQIEGAHANGALSDSGYNQIVSGNVTPDNLADFMAADPGASQTSSAPSIAVSNVNAPLVPRSSPSVMVPTSSFGAWFSQSSLIGGIPNYLVLGGLVAALMILPVGGRRR